MVTTNMVRHGHSGWLVMLRESDICRWWLWGEMAGSGCNFMVVRMLHFWVHAGQSVARQLKPLPVSCKELCMLLILNGGSSGLNRRKRILLLTFLTFVALC